MRKEVVIVIWDEMSYNSQLNNLFNSKLDIEEENDTTFSIDKEKEDCE